MLPQHPINIRELINECFSNDSSKEQRSSLRKILGSKTCRSDFKCFDVKFYVSAFVGVIIKVILLKEFPISYIVLWTKITVYLDFKIRNLYERMGSGCNCLGIVSSERRLLNQASFLTFKTFPLLKVIPAHNISQTLNEIYI